LTPEERKNIEEFFRASQRHAGLNLTGEELSAFLLGALENYAFLEGLDDIVTPENEEPASYRNLLASSSTRKTPQK
jgi:hypothetical protein